jgi:hypothetical protein
MATIDIGDNDQVFVFTRSAEINPPKPMTHELDRKSMMLVIEQNDPIEGELQCVPQIRVFVGGEPVGLIQGLSIDASSEASIAKIEFKILSSEIKGTSDTLKLEARRSLELLRRLIPYVNIKEVGLDGETIHEQGLNLSV